MSDLMFSSVFGTADSLVSSVSASSFLLCSVVSIVLGLVIAGVYMFRHRYSKNFVVTLALLPLIVQMVITLVNGNLGAGIAVMGVFNLVRFRSIPGSAKDIGSVFLAMAVGLATVLVLSVIYLAASAVITLGYSVFYVEVMLPNGSVGQLLDIMDYVSNSVMMPFIALLSTVLIGWVMTPDYVIDEMERNGETFRRKKLYRVMIRYVAPVMMFVLFLQSTGILSKIG